MNWNDLKVFFDRMKLEEPYLPSSSNRDDLIRGYLSQCSDNALLDIANQLGLDVPRNESELARLGDSKYWLIDHFRVFISHVHTIKASASALGAELKKYAISSFVAHEDIEPTDEWQEEILRSLGSMDALIAIITHDFNSSKWTDQEVGIGVARDVVIIAIIKGAEPYGFIHKYHAISGDGKSVPNVAGSVFRTICSNPRSQDRMVDCLVRTISTGSDVDGIIFRLDKLNGIEGVGVDQWEKIRENVASNSALRRSKRFVDAINAMLTDRKVAPIEFGEPKLDRPLDDEIPF